MSMYRTVKCDICGEEYTEKEYGAGFPEWMLINGIVLDGISEIWICPTHRDMIADYVDNLKNGN